MTTLNYAPTRPGLGGLNALREPTDDTGVQLTPRMIAAWESRLGVDRHRLAHPSRFFGATGVQEWQGGVDMIPRDIDRFSAVRFERELSTTATFCALYPPARIARTAERVRTDPYELLLVTVTSMRGRTVLRQDGKEHAYSAGDLMFVSTASPFLQSAANVTDPSGLAIPLAMLGRHRALAERRGRPTNKPTLLSGAAAGFVRRFAADTAAADVPLPSADAELAAVDLITAALAELASDEGYRLQDDVLFNNQSALELIARRHRDPDFTPDSIAAELHLSRRQLYRLFENSGRSLATRIADARVETAREMLGANPWLPVSSISAACGFGSVATFRNRFKTRYGIGPVEYRQSVAR
ncbi:AraC family transcriptional regulator [Gordonia sp. MP11Mi]|uniref:HTH araC/xylS-type domain-containing protein n=1 Tax=Gordonia sp. MP11Mi TaxID=3022769 RepID=A0AA97CXH6_9ACTN